MSELNNIRLTNDVQTLTTLKQVQTVKQGGSTIAIKGENDPYKNMSVHSSLDFDGSRMDPAQQKRRYGSQDGEDEDYPMSSLRTTEIQRNMVPKKPTFRINNVTQNIARPMSPESRFQEESTVGYNSTHRSPKKIIKKEEKVVDKVVVSTAERRKREKIREKNYSKLSKDDIIRRKIQVQRQVLEARRLNKNYELPEYESKVAEPIQHAKSTS